VLTSGYVPARSQSTEVFDHYVGALHEHSGYSDGFPGSEPRDYFESGKAFGLDFMGSGEHSDNAGVPIVASEWCIDEPPVDPTIPDCAVADKDTPEDSFRKWDATQEAAQAVSTDAYTAFRGFEWTSDRFGHINVYFSTNDTNAKADGGYAAMDTFWEWFTRDPSLGGGADGLATFNHPGSKSLDDADPGFNWNSFAYVPEADQRMVGLEVFNGDDEFEVKNERGYFTQALDAGWHVGAIGAEDKGHDWSDGDGEGDDDWGGPAWPKTVVIATDNSPDAIREAMVARRFYAVRDPSIRMDLTAAGQPMGSRLEFPIGSTVPISVTVGNVPSAASVEIVTNGGEKVATGATTVAYEAPAMAGERYYFARVLDAAGTPIAYTSPVWITGDGGSTSGGEWVAGDFHVHTTYSHDSYGGPSDDNTGPEEFYVAGHTVTSEFAVAASRGLDFSAITDHMDVRSQSDPGWQFAKDQGLIPVPGYENSLNGHAQMLGATKVYDNRDKSAATVNALAQQLRDDGGIFQINHPTDGDGRYPDNMGWDYGFDVVPDTVEIWNITRLWEKPMPSSNSHDDATRYWQEWLDKGHHVTATGGSDTHWVSTTAAQGVGQPTTWVFVEERTAAGIMEGLRSGHTFITHQPPNYGGAQIFLEGDADRDGTYEAIVGDTVPTGSPLRARVVGAPGSMLRVVTDGGNEAFPPVPVTGPSFTVDFTLPAGTWVRAEAFEPDAAEQRRAACDQPLGDETTYCRNQLGIVTMTSALYLDGEPEPTPTPTTSESPGDTTYEFGSTYARVSDEGVVLGNDLVERSWERTGFSTTRMTDKRGGGKEWAAAGPDFTLDLGATELSSTSFDATGVTVEEIEGHRGPGLRVRFDLTSPALAAERVVEIYEGVAGFRTRTILEPLAPLPLFGYSLDEAVVGDGVTPTIHAFRAGADWRDPINGWEGPEKPHEQWPLPTSIGDPHGGTWRDTHSADRGAALQGPAQWISLADGERTAFLVMERNDNPSSRAAYDGGTARLQVDLTRDVILLGPFEETVHVENPTDAPARHRLLKPGQTLALEPAFVGFGSHGGDEAWQFHKYLVDHRLIPYAHDVTFNSNGTDDEVISTGAKDDMNFATVQEVAPKARALGVDTFILDDGWQAISGDWNPDCPDHLEPRHDTDPVKYAPRFPDCNFEAVREAIAPMKLGLWMNAMHFHPESETYKAHPEWACTPTGHGTAAANAADPESGSNEAGIGTWGPDAIPHVEGRIRNAIENWDVKYFKFDFLVWLDCAGQGDLYDYREAFMAMLDRLRGDHPDVTFEIDETNDYRLFPFESVARGPSWFQNGNPVPRHLLHNLWNLSPFVPTFSLGQGFLGNSGARLEHGVDTNMAVALLSHMTYFGDLRHISDADISAARPWTDFYRDNRDVLGHAVYPLLDDPLDDGWTALQSWDPEKGEGVLLAFRQNDERSSVTIPLANIPASRRFDLSIAPTGETLGTYSSEQLSNGIEINLNEKKRARVIVIRPTGDDPTPTPSGSATTDPTEDTTLQFTNDSAESGQYTDDARFEVLLTAEDGAPVANQEIEFELVGSTTRTFTATTDGSGIASHTITLDEQPGPFQLFARYAGIPDRYAPVASTTGFVVEREDTNLGISVVGKGANRSLIATLTDADSSSGIAGRAVEFTSNGTVVCTVSTNAAGHTTCDPGSYKDKNDYQAVFREDDYFLGSASSVQ
jgi:Melibiase